MSASSGGDGAVLTGARSAGLAATTLLLSSHLKPLCKAKLEQALTNISFVKFADVSLPILSPPLALR
jgi:hypothetical protein